MIQFFRQNNFFTALMLIPYTFLVRLACFFISEGPQPMESAGYLYTIFADAFKNQVVLSFITINLVIAFTAILVNRIVIVHRLSRVQSLIPGLVYIILVSWIESFLSFTAIHVANFFVMLGLLALFKFSKKTTSGIVVFDSFFYFGLAALFYTPYMIYIIVVFAGFISLNRFRFRDLIHAFIGFLIPFFIISGFLYYSTNQINFLVGFNFNTLIIEWIKNMRLLDLIPIAFYGLIILMCILNYGVLVRKNSIIIQKKINILFYFLPFMAATLLFINDQNSNYFIIFALPAAILFGMVVERVKAPAIEEFLHLVTLVMIFFIHFSSTVNILN